MSSGELCRLGEQRPPSSAQKHPQTPRNAKKRQETPRNALGLRQTRAQQAWRAACGTDLLKVPGQLGQGLVRGLLYPAAVVVDVQLREEVVARVVPVVEHRLDLPVERAVGGGEKGGGERQWQAVQKGSGEGSGRSATGREEGSASECRMSRKGGERSRPVKEGVDFTCSKHRSTVGRPARQIEMTSRSTCGSRALCVNTVARANYQAGVSVKRF